MRVEVLRSAKRRKTVSARQVGDVLRVSIPAWMGRAEEQKWVAEMLRRFERTRATAALDLEGRAARLAARYRLPVPASVRWADNQRSRWGSCTPADRSIRISSRLTDVPVWVLDYVLVHELAHLLEAGHGPAFRSLVGRYPLAERATGFLMAKGLDGDAGDEPWPPPDPIIAPGTGAPPPSATSPRAGRAR